MQICRIQKFGKNLKRYSSVNVQATFKIDSQCMKCKCKNAELLETISIEYTNKNHSKWSSRTQNPTSRTLINSKNELTHECKIGCSEWWIGYSNGSETTCISSQWRCKRELNLKIVNQHLLLVVQVSLATNYHKMCLSTLQFPLGTWVAGASLL